MQDFKPRRASQQPREKNIVERVINVAFYIAVPAAIIVITYISLLLLTVAREF